MTAFSYDLAISAVPYDAVFVNELMAELAPRLRTMPVWAGHAGQEPPAPHAMLVADQSRLALVLHQRLWRHDARTQADASVLRERVRERPDSVRVMMLDDAPLPPWLSRVQTCDLRSSGLAGVANFTADAIASSGGAVSRAEVPAPAAAGPMRWSEGPTPFLSQPRAQSALRHELDAIAAELKSHIASRQASQPDETFELHALPHRLIARFADRGISFSWIGGSLPSVTEGRLLVIEWSGVAPQTRGVAALKSATPVREQSYRAEGTSPETWRWRMDGANGRAFSTVNLVAEGTSSVGLVSGD
jgi:hypothetical protein